MQKNLVNIFEHGTISEDLVSDGFGPILQVDTIVYDHPN